MRDYSLGFEPRPAVERAVRLARKDCPVCFDDGEVGDLARDALVAGLPLWHKARSGHLYLAANASWAGLYKIGCTRRSVMARMAQLNSEGVPTPWLAIASWAVYDAHGLEALAHRACAKWHITGEMFQAPYQDLIQCINECIDADRERLAQYLGRHLMPDLLDDLLGGVSCQIH